MDEEKILRARLKELAERAYRQNVYTFSSFLAPADMHVFDSMREELDFAHHASYGGCEWCERQMLRFGSEEMFGYAAEWPIAVLKTEPLAEKFAARLSHRDFLGAIMNLGIERSTVGDIFVREEKRAYIFCQEGIADFIAENLTKVKHTNVRCRQIEPECQENGQNPLAELAPKLVDVDCIVSAPRFDAVLAAIAKCSRNEAAKLFQTGKVVLNGRTVEKNSVVLREGDVFSVRGCGKYRYCGTGNETRKGRIYIHLKQYI